MQFQILTPTLTLWHLLKKPEPYTTTYTPSFLKFGHQDMIEVQLLSNEPITANMKISSLVCTNSDNTVHEYELHPQLPT